MPPANWTSVITWSTVVYLCPLMPSFDTAANESEMLTSIRNKYHRCVPSPSTCPPRSRTAAYDKGFMKKFSVPTHFNAASIKDAQCFFQVISLCRRAPLKIRDMSMLTHGSHLDLARRSHSHGPLLLLPRVLQRLTSSLRRCDGCGWPPDASLTLEIVRPPIARVNLSGHVSVL